MSVATPIPLLQHLPDVNVTPAVGVDEYALVYDHDTARFVLRAPFSGTPYALLAGRAGGQTLYGGTAANDDITIHGTSDATRTTSYVLLQPTAGNVGIGTTAPATALHVVGAATITGGIRPAADGTTALQLQTAAGASVLNVDTTNNNVGIGTTSPGYALDVQGAAPGNWVSSRIQNTSDGAASLIFGTSNTPTPNNWSININAVAQGDFNIASGINAGGTSRLYINASGNVGIGTTSPATALHVVGAATVTGGIRPAADSTTALQLQNAAGTSILNIDTTNGWVGIGTTVINPYGSGNLPTTLQINSPNTWAELKVTNSTTGNTDAAGLHLLAIGLDGYLHNASAGNLSFGTSDTNRMTILGTGNVGIGTTSPATALHVVGAATITGGIRPAADSTTALQLQTAAGTSILNIDTTNGWVGIGTTAPLSKLSLGPGGTGVGSNNVRRIAVSQEGDGSYFYGIGYLGDPYGTGLYAGKASGTANPDLFIQATTGNVGIGDTAPAEKLDVTGNINATGVYKVDDVQVLSNRVIDARCADVANSGDATTDGLIDALRDAMVAHGLIAAA